MTLSRITMLSALTLAAIVAPLSAADAPSPQASIAARQAGYKKIGAAMKSLREQLTSAAPDKAVMLDAAQTIAATVPGQAGLFPAGSGPEAGVHTDALPLIWTDRATFDADMARLITESAKLETVAGGGDVAAIGAQVKATGAACGACHHQFRADT